MTVAVAAWEAVIGLEIHAQIKTASKQYCRCPSVFVNDPAEANKYVCPVCLGHPGVLPVLNGKSVELALRLASAAGSRIAAKNVFARKNYFYPDLPKGYQITQYDVPLAEGGALPYIWKQKDAGEPISKEARLVRMHLEEDTGKLYHLPDGTSIVDFNRSGVPLIEIVTQPDFRSPDMAVAFLEELRLTMIYLGVSDANMELGEMRCEPNISVRPAGADELLPKVEIKNLNSFATLRKAVAYEIERQAAVWEKGGRVLPQTMRWDEGATGFDGRTGAALPMRTKETADDYRYFDEPDLPPLVVTPAMTLAARPFADKTAYRARVRLTEVCGLSEYDARNIATIPSNLDWFDALLPDVGDAKLTANWVLGEISRFKSELGDAFRATAIEAAKVISALKSGKVTNAQAKTAFEKLARDSGDADAILSEHAASAGSGLDLDRAIAAVIAANPKPVADYRGGKSNAIMVLVGQVMKETRGAADAGKVREMLENAINTPE